MHRANCSSVYGLSTFNSDNGTTFGRVRICGESEAAAAAAVAVEVPVLTFAALTAAADDDMPRRHGPCGRAILLLTRKNWMDDNMIDAPKICLVEEILVYIGEDIE